MTKRTGIGLDRIRERGFPGEGLRAGMAKDQLIFVIICSAAIAVAVITMVFMFSGGSSGRMGVSQWQCLNTDCGNEFSNDTQGLSPVKCEKCGGQAASVNRRKCPACEENVLVSRMRLAEQGQAQYQNIKESSGQMRAMPVMPGMELPMEIQFWMQQADGSYGWTDWIFAAGPQSGQVSSSLTCPKCNAPLYGRRSR